MPEKFDILIIGSGIAGLSAALEASELGKDVCLLEQGTEKSSNSYYAQGGIAAAFNEKDSWKKHAEDTLKAGAGLCDEKIVSFITKNAEPEIRKLIEAGLIFDGGENPEMGLEGGHSEKRVLHIKGDQTGKEITKFMRKIAGEKRGITFIENTFMKKIHTVKSGGSKSFSAIEAIGKESEIYAGSLILCTGGYGACFQKTTNPATTLGSGMGIAMEAGCETAGMEFTQFHPTTLNTKTGENFLVTEAVRGEGGSIINEKGTRIVNPLDTRDKVSITVYSEIIKGGKAFLDAREMETEFEKRFPQVYARLLEDGVNPANDLIPIEAAAHYTIGGIKTDYEGRSNVKGIYACGECSNSGFHGANRLASNSLLEGLVMGKVAARSAAKNSRTKPENITAAKETEGSEESKNAKRFAEMKRIMWEKCGIVREKEKMLSGLAELKRMESQCAENPQEKEEIILKKSLQICIKTFEHSLAREKSVGTHYRIN